MQIYSISIPSFSHLAKIVKYRRSIYNFDYMENNRNQIIDFKLLDEKGVTLVIKREDEIHPYISGNKYRKLKYNLEEAKKQGMKNLVSFGGAYSNHISALSFAGKEYGFETLGIIRGDELGDDLEKTLTQNPTLRFAHENGMKFKFSL